MPDCYFCAFLFALILCFDYSQLGVKQGKEKDMENQNMETVKTEGVGTDTAQEPTEKLFTQEQVNEIIRKRLKDQKEAENNIQEINIREAQLTSRENRLNCREYLIEKDYPVELLDIIDTSDVKAFKDKADRASGVFESRQQNQFIAPLASTEPSMFNCVKSAFENTKHQPKGYWATDPKRKE